MVILCSKLGADVPFRKIYLHPMIRDAHGCKMSKSLINVDPLEVINEKSLEGLRKGLEDGYLDVSEAVRAIKVQKDFPNGISECGAVYFWWQSQLCDVFIEVIKPYFSGNDESLASARDSARATLWVCLDTGLRLLHPFMPFVTEELWQRLPQPKDTVKKESIVISEYPAAIKSWSNESVEREMELIEAAVKSLRSLKSVLPPKERNERRQAFALCRSEGVAEVIRSHELDILTLVGLSSLEVLNESDAAPLGCSVDVVNENISVYLKVKGMINAEVELQKLRKKMEETKRQKDTLEKMMGASGYKEKVRAQIHEENVAKLTKLMQEILSLEEASQHLESDIAVENN